MNCLVGLPRRINKIGDSPAIGLSTAIGCMLDLPGLPGAGNKIYDRSPYGNQGTITGATWIRLPSGLWVLDFDGTDDHIVVSHHSSLAITEDIILKAWVNWTSGDSQIIGKGSFVGWQFMWYFYIRADGTIAFICGNVAGDGKAFDLFTTDALTSGVWTKIECLKRGAVSEIYINGELSKSGAAATNWSDSSDVWLGERITGIFDLTGSIALPRIYNRALSALEIQNHYQQEKHLFGVW